MELRGKTAVITGGASGIGLGMARSFAAEGMKLVLADIEQAPLDTAVTELSATTDVVGIRIDVSQRDEVEALATATMDEFGAAHVLCNNAGVGIADPVWAMSIEDWRWTIDINLWGPIYGIQAFHPIMERQGEGHINATASMAGLYAGQSLGAYNVTKHGVVALMQSLARDLRTAKSPIRASVLCPGPVDTKITDSERNRSPESASHHVGTEAGNRFFENLTTTLQAGMHPDAVGDLVATGIKTDRFWMITHPHYLDGVIEQTKHIATGDLL